MPKVNKQALRLDRAVPGLLQPTSKVVEQVKLPGMLKDLLPILGQ